jgi:hypothetical protein
VSQPNPDAPAPVNDGWSWSEGISAQIDFAIHVLLVDGLHVAPFDKHAGGDGSCRALGLDQRTWGRWVIALINLREVVNAERLAAGPDPDGNRKPTDAELMLQRPAVVCPGSPELVHRLREIWEEYIPGFPEWARATVSPEASFARMSADRQRSLWLALQPLRPKVPRLAIYIVRYPVPEVMAVDPATAVISPDLTGDYARQIWFGATVLSE